MWRLFRLQASVAVFNDREAAATPAPASLGHLMETMLMISFLFHTPGPFLPWSWLFCSGHPMAGEAFHQVLCQASIQQTCSGLSPRPVAFPAASLPSGPPAAPLTHTMGEHPCSCFSCVWILLLWIVES